MLLQAVLRKNDAPLSNREDNTKDTDTLTRIDRAAEAPTIRPDSPDAETERLHKLEPRVWSPLRVCPECSFAWETEADWCPSCGTAFNSKLRARTAVQRSTRVAPRRSTPKAVAPPRRRDRTNVVPPAPPAPQGSSAGKVIATTLVFVLAVVGAFLIGQQTRASKEEVDRSVAEAVQNTKESAVASFEREFNEQRARLQKEFNQRVKAAEAKARDEGRAQGQAQAKDEQGSGMVDKLERCFSNFLIDC